VSGDAVEDRGEDLGAVQAHVVVGLVDHELVHDELVSRHAGDPVSELLDTGVEFVGGNGFIGSLPLGFGSAKVEVSSINRAAVASTGIT
jgi:hypothetical protein